MTNLIGLTLFILRAASIAWQQWGRDDTSSGLNLFRRLLLTLGLAAGLIHFPAAAQSPQSGTRSGVTISLPNGYATLKAEDLRLMTPAGEIKWQRHWDGHEWKIQPQWESLSQSWKNLTGSHSADSTAGTVSASGTATGGGGRSGGHASDCWVWVDEDWQPSAGTATLGGLPEAAPLIALRSTPFNRQLSETGQDYPPVGSPSPIYSESGSPAT